MAKAEYDKEVTETVKVKCLKCDLCDKIIKPGKIAIRVHGVKVLNQSWSVGDVYMGPEYLDVCSTPCLSKNIGGVCLPLDTDILPKVEESSRKMNESNDKIWTAPYPQQQIYKTTGTGTPLPVYVDNTTWSGPTVSDTTP